jgi:hypothetical protein
MNEVNIGLLRPQIYAISPPKQGMALQHPSAAAADKTACFRKRRISLLIKRDTSQERYQTSEVMAP